MSNIKKDVSCHRNIKNGYTYERELLYLFLMN